MRLRKLGICLLALGLVAIVGSTASAQPSGKGKWNKEKLAGKKDRHGPRGRPHWGPGFRHARAGFAMRGHRGRHGLRPAFRPGRGVYRGRFAARWGRPALRHGHRGRDRWHGQRGFRGRFAPRGRAGRNWHRPGMGARFDGRFSSRFGGKGLDRGRLLRTLKLSEEQQKKLAALRKTHMETARAAMKKALESTRQEMQKGLKGILTPEQYKKYQEAEQKSKAPAGKDKSKAKDKNKAKDEIETSANPRLSTRPALVAASANAARNSNSVRHLSSSRRPWNSEQSLS